MARQRTERNEGQIATRRLEILAGAAALIWAPVVALRGLDSAAWDLPGDLIFLAGLLVGVGVAHELAIRIPGRMAYAAGLALAVWTAGFCAWINVAVGIIGSEDNPANLIYAGVIAVAASGATLARFRPSGMVRAMVATAIAQAFAFIVALVAGLGFTGPITIFFCALWLASAWLFSRASFDRGGDGQGS